MKITGDTHGERARFSALVAENKGETLIIAGDCGLLFRNDVEERRFLDELSREDITLCFVDGNHENFDALSEYPVEIWKGGKVHRIRDNIFHLMRGQFFRIEGHSVFTMGGAYSRDRYMRTEGVSFWHAELPTKEEYEEAARNLALHHFKADYIITHTAPREIVRRMGRELDPHDAELTGFLEWIMYETEYKGWFFGHWHEEKEIGNHRALWFDVVEV